MPYTQSNGMVQRLLHSVKSLLKRVPITIKICILPLLDYCDILFLKPCTMTHGEMHKNLPSHYTQNLLKPKVIGPKSVQKELLWCKTVQKYYYNCHTKPLKELEEDEAV